MKYGRGDVGRRVQAQGQWLRDHPSPSVPRVLNVFEDGYVMPRLEEFDRTVEYDWAFLGAIVARLQAHVWSRAAEVALDPQAHITKVLGLAVVHLEERQVRKLGEIFDAITWDRLPRCLTHGDPTWDNVMRSHRGGMVLIDPIPATPAVPDLRCVDLGKMLQSTYGYERIRYAELGLDVDPEYVEKFCVDDNEWRAAMYWCAVHLLRCAPYVPKEVWVGLQGLEPLRGL